ncbi:hypothetical protein ACMZOO_13330 [Catenovulum sp. SX2]|uniref:hypothetical protein n=1 Tax=Catenovulum sp. SX2 TaxID=3398614 RepID=UPI003F86B694
MKLRLIGLACCAFIFLSGCASNIQSTRINDKKPLPQGHGIVAVQVINNTDRLAPLHQDWTNIYAVRIDNREALKQAAIEKAKAKAKQYGKKFDESKVDWDLDVYEMYPASEGVINSQLFVGSMPAGEYLISSLYSYYSDGQMSSWISMPVGYNAGTFEVGSKQITGLGTIAFQPLLSIKSPSFWNMSSSKKAFVVRLSERQYLERFVVQEYPNISKSLNQSKVLGWKEDILESIREKIGSMARKNAYGEQVISLSNTLGHAAIAAKFGQLRVLDNEGSWQQFDLPTNAQLSATVEIDNKIYVAGERGQVFVSDDKGQNWQSFNPVSTQEAIMWLGYRDDKGYAVTSSSKAHKVYQFSEISQAWKKVGEFKRVPGASFWVQNGGMFPFFNQLGQLNIINDTKLHAYDFNSGKWAMSKTKALKKFAQMADGSLLGIEVSQWDGYGDQVFSLDEGKSWNTVSRSLRWGDVKSETSLPAVLPNELFVTVGRIKKSNDRSLKILSAPFSEITKEQVTWKTHGLVKESCATLLPSLTLNDTLYFQCDQGQVVSTRDLGETWDTVVDIDIARLQNEYDNLLIAIKLMAEKKQAESQAKKTESDPEQREAAKDI